MITPRQEKFIAAYMETGNASEAYRAAYHCEKMKPATINRRAFELINNGKITARLDAMRERAARGAELTLAGHLQDLKELSEASKERGQYAAAISAEIARGKAAGLYTNRVKAEVTAESVCVHSVEIHIVKPVEIVAAPAAFVEEQLRGMSDDEFSKLRGMVENERLRRNAPIDIDVIK